MQLPPALALGPKEYHLKEIRLISQHKSKQYNGPALEVPTGVSVAEVRDTLEKQGFTALGGDCSSVGPQEITSVLVVAWQQCSSLFRRWPYTGS